MARATSSGRNASGSGSIRKKTIRQNGKDYTYWEGRCTVGYHPGTGRQIQRSVTGKTQREVMQKLRQITQELDLGTYHEPADLHWANGWIVGPQTILAA